MPGTDYATAPWSARYSTIAFTVLRIVAGLMFAQHGAQKLLGAFGGVGDTPGMTVPLMSQFGLAGILELCGGLAIALGLGTRIVALLISGEMAVAYFQAHFPRSPVPIINRGELAALYCFVWLAFVTIGAGPYSIDALIGRRKPAATP